MNTAHTLQKLSKLGKILSKIAFIFAVIGFVGCIAGIASAQFGSGPILKLGGVTLYGLIPGSLSGNIKGVCAALSGWLVICAGEAVLAKFAEVYFSNVLKAETPFTLAGAKELLRLGILTAAIPTGCAVLGDIVQGVVSGLLRVTADGAMDVYTECGSALVLGMAFILGSLLCRLGAEQKNAA